MLFLTTQESDFKECTCIQYKNKEHIYAYVIKNCEGIFCIEVCRQLNLVGQGQSHNFVRPLDDQDTHQV